MPSCWREKATSPRINRDLTDDAIAKGSSSSAAGRWRSRPSSLSVDCTSAPRTRHEALQRYGGITGRLDPRCRGPTKRFGRP